MPAVPLVVAIAAGAGSLVAAATVVAASAPAQYQLHQQHCSSYLSAVDSIT